jgi:hypothetical protein
MHTGNASATFLCDARRLEHGFWPDATKTIAAISPAALDAKRRRDIRASTDPVVAVVKDSNGQKFDYVYYE